MKQRKICIVTATRAEYGLLSWLMREVAEDQRLELQIIAAGQHLSAEFGLTYREIEKDGFSINEKVDYLIPSDSCKDITKSIAAATSGFADSFQKLNPDIIVVLGDRSEVLAAATAALIAKIPLAHIHGGEVTAGAIDDSIRHAVTKLSHLHFVAADSYRKRVIQLGENPDRVFNFGAPGLDVLRRTEILSRENFEESIGFKLGQKNLLITYHPETLGSVSVEYSINQLLLALEEYPDVHMIFTQHNSDENGKVVGDKIQEFVAKHNQRAMFVHSLGHKRYLSALHNVDAVIGNSSSGIIEAPSAKIPTVNIGSRQSGRLRANSIIDCGSEKENIVRAIDKAFSNEFVELAKNCSNPYGDGNTATLIKDCLAATSLSNITQKKFYDL